MPITLPDFNLRVKILVPGARAPAFGRYEDAGFDLFSIENYRLAPGQGCLFRTGFATAFPEGWVGLVLDRGSMGVKGIMRRAGVIDAGFRGEWKVSLFNTGLLAIDIVSVLSNPQAKAAAQVVFVPYGKASAEIVDELPESLRGLDWDGSTDVHNRNEA